MTCESFQIFLFENLLFLFCRHDCFNKVSPIRIHQWRETSQRLPWESVIRREIKLGSVVVASIAWENFKKKQQSDFEKMSQINNTVTIKRPLAVPFTVKLDLKKFSDTKEYSSNFFSKCAGYQIIVWAFLVS